MNISDYKNISKIPIDYSWSFSDKTIKDTSYITHGYYTYPAKFIPQLASRLIQEYSNENDIVIDTFLGSGTTIVEAIVNNRIGIGTDINNIAHLIAKVKTTPLNIIELNKKLTDIYNDLNNINQLTFNNINQLIFENERINYWFLPPQKEKLLKILNRILEIKNKDIQEFFIVSFCQILKSCSIWLQKSIKPTRDNSKQLQDPYRLFFKQAKKMIKGHEEFLKLLNPLILKNINNYRNIICGDSRNQPCKENTATLIVTSPPYVTSYEYADLHQLPSLWLGYITDLTEFRKRFIGSAYTNRKEIDLKSNTAENIILKLGKNKKSQEVKNYFADILETFYEMKRILKNGGKASIVIGNTQYKGVDILNAEVFIEQFHNIGFKTHKIIKREIPSKMLPSIRDKKSGQFVKSDNTDSKLAYPTEYILIMEKL